MHQIHLNPSRVENSSLIDKLVLTNGFFTTKKRPYQWKISQQQTIKPWLKNPLQSPVYMSRRSGLADNNLFTNTSRQLKGTMFLALHKRSKPNFITSQEKKQAKRMASQKGFQLTLYQPLNHQLPDYQLSCPLANQALANHFLANHDQPRWSSQNYTSC